MRDGEKPHLQREEGLRVLVGWSGALGDGRPAVRRTFLAGLEACLFTKMDVLLRDKERVNIESVAAHQRNVH